MNENLKDLSEKIRTKEELFLFLKKLTSRETDLEKEEIAKLEKKLRSLPEVKMEIAFFPNNDFINRVSQWLERELKQKIILDITVNPGVVAGAIIEYRGNWRDFSIAKKLDQLFDIKLKN